MTLFLAYTHVLKSAIIFLSTKSKYFALLIMSFNDSGIQSMDSRSFDHSYAIDMLGSVDSCVEFVLKASIILVTAFCISSIG